jgi:hypothetical protein
MHHPRQADVVGVSTAAVQMPQGAWAWNAFADWGLLAGMRGHCSSLSFAAAMTASTIA